MIISAAYAERYDIQIHFFFRIFIPNISSSKQIKMFHKNIYNARRKGVRSQITQAIVPTLKIVIFYMEMLMREKLFNSTTTFNPDIPINMW